MTRRVLGTYTAEEFNALFEGCPPATDDDVSITMDGRRLDTIDKARAFLAEIDAERIAIAATDRAAHDLGIDTH